MRLVPQLLVALDASGVHAQQDGDAVTSSPGDLGGGDSGVELRVSRRCAAGHRVVRREVSSPGQR